MNPDTTATTTSNETRAHALSRNLLEVALGVHTPAFRKMVGGINFRSAMANPAHGRERARWHKRQTAWRRKMLRCGVPFHNKGPRSTLQVSGPTKLEKRFAMQDKERDRALASA